MTTLAAWRPATAYTKGATVRPNATQGAVPVPLVNGNFNSGDTAWTKDTGWAISTGDAYEGTHKGIYTGTGAGTIKASGTYASTPGQVITATIKAKVLDDADGATAFLKWYDASAVLISTTTGLESSVETGVWMQLTVVGQAPANTATVVFGVEATRTVGANVMIDDARWDYAAPIEARRLAYRSVQETAGVSGVVEPTWPTTVGNRVNDGTVVWETVELDWIEWTAQPILESGLTEPVWPTSVGGFVGDGTINWECTSRRVEDEKCPNTKVVCIINSKVFAVDEDIVRYSATAMPLDWSTASDAGYLPTGLQQANANDMAVLYPYRGNLCAWNANCFQMWQTDPDPTQMALLDQMDGIGSTHPLAARAVGNDLYFLSNQGVRSVGIANAAQNLQAGDVGMPIDLLVQAAMVQWAIDGNKALSTYWPSMGQYWLCGGDDGVTAGAGGALALACPTNISAFVGEAYSYTYVATGGTAPYTFSVVSGTLPPGLTLDEDTGVLSGTLTTAGAFSFGVQVMDALGVVAYCGWSAEVVEDEVTITEIAFLVTGSAKTPGGPVFATAEAVAVPVFAGIAQATGADIEAGVPAYYDGQWGVVATDEVRYASALSSWATGSMASFDAPNWLVGGHAGWVGNESPHTATDPTGHVCASSAPIAFVSTAFTGMYSDGVTSANSVLTFAKNVFYVDGYYYRNNQRGLFRSATPTGTYTAVWDEIKIAAAGQDPNGACIIWFEDMCKIGGDYYAVIWWHFDEGSRRSRIVRSVNGINDWSVLDVLVDTAWQVSGAPSQLCDCDGEIVSYAHGGGVWTSVNGWAAWVNNGITGSPRGPRKMAYAAGFCFAIDGTDKCVVSANKGLTWGAPITMPVDDAIGIAVGYSL